MAAKQQNPMSNEGPFFKICCTNRPEEIQTKDGTARSDVAVFSSINMNGEKRQNSQSYVSKLLRRAEEAAVFEKKNLELKTKLEKAQQEMKAINTEKEIVKRENQTLLDEYKKDQALLSQAKAIRAKKKKQQRAVESPAYTIPDILDEISDDEDEYAVESCEKQLEEQFGNTNALGGEALKHGVVAFRASHLEKAKIFFHLSLKYSKQAENKLIEARACSNLSNVYSAQNRLEKSIVMFRHAVRVLRKLKEVKMESHILENGINVAIDLRLYDEALGLALRKMAISDTPEQNQRAVKFIKKINNALSSGYSDDVLVTTDCFYSPIHSPKSSIGSFSEDDTSNSKLNRIQRLGTTDFNFTPDVNVTVDISKIDRKESKIKVPLTQMNSSDAAIKYDTKVI